MGNSNRIAPVQYAKHMPDGKSRYKILLIRELSLDTKSVDSRLRPTNGIFLFSFGTDRGHI